jgi:hypothetical protein
MTWQFKWKTRYRNLSLGFVTKVKGLQGCGPKGSSAVTPHAPGSVGKCEGVNPRTPKATPTWEMETQWTLKFSKGDCMGENSMAWGILYIIGKLLELRCLKWACIAHLEIWNTSYDQKKGWKSNWQIDFHPLKVGNWSDLLIYRWRVTYHWNALDEGYNFVLDLISIGGLLATLWRPKVAGVPTPYTYDVFYLGFTFESLKVLGVRH